MPLITSETKSETINKREFETLSGLLKLRRQGDPWLTEFIDTLGHVYGERTEAMPCKAIPGLFIRSLESTGSSSDPEEITGFIWDQGRDHDGVTTYLHGLEAAPLLELLQLLRGSSWLGSFLGVIINMNATWDRAVRPLDVAQIVAQEVEDFNQSLEVARHTLATYPEEFPQLVCAARREEVLAK